MHTGILLMAVLSRCLIHKSHTFFLAVLRTSARRMNEAQASPLWGKNKTWPVHVWEVSHMSSKTWCVDEQFLLVALVCKQHFIFFILWLSFPTCFAAVLKAPQAGRCTHHSEGTTKQLPCDSDYVYDCTLCKLYRSVYIINHHTPSSNRHLDLNWKRII